MAAVKRQGPRSTSAWRPTRLAELLRKKGLSASSLARELGLSRGTVLNWTRGLHAPSIDLLVEVADELGCTTDYLLGRTE